MDRDKVVFLFGELPLGADPDDQETRHRLVREPLADDDLSVVDAFVAAAHEHIADEIASDDPPEVWQAARRMLEAGLRREVVMANLFLARNTALRRALRETVPLDRAVYVAALARLPLVSPRDALSRIVAVARDHRSLPSGELVAEVVARLASLQPASGPATAEDDREMLDDYVDQALDTLLNHGDGPLLMLFPDLVVDMPSLLHGAVLSHRLTAREAEHGEIAVEPDLAPLYRLPPPVRLATGGEVTFDVDPYAGDVIVFPEGVLDDINAGTALGIRVELVRVEGGDACILSLEMLETCPPPRPEAAAAARTAYDREVAEPWLPVEGSDIVAFMLLSHPGVFSEPTAPLPELFAAAGLERRGSEYAHEESVWREQRRARRIHALSSRLDDRAHARLAFEVLEVFDGPAAVEKRRKALSALREPEVLSAVADELLDGRDAPELDDVTEVAEELLVAARQPREAAPARFLLALAEERRVDPIAAQAHLELALDADPSWPPVIDRLAWYSSDRGDAERSLRLLGRLGAHDDDKDVETLAEFVGARDDRARGLGRNDPCFCGSGRKFKHCHLNAGNEHPLPDRVGWMCRKAVAYLERRGGNARRDVSQLAVIRTGDARSRSAIERAFGDPMLLDAVLHEGGWFEQFLSERGALLPDDESMLARAWSLVDRTLYEVVATRPGQGMTVRDLRSAELVEVRERTFSHEARVGQVFCGRAVPDGETHQFIGGILPVRTGQEGDLLDLLDRRDPEELMAWVAASERPPRLVTREGEPLRACSVTLGAPDAAAARRALDAHFEPTGSGEWAESHVLPHGEHIRRATLRLDGSTIVVETLSEERVERVLAVLEGELGRVQVMSDERRPVDPAYLPKSPGTGARLDDEDLQHPALQQAMREFIAERELAWCEEEIPALRGLTPRQAADDPAGREALERLLVEYRGYIDPSADADLVPQHPDRLRKLLGL
ncbi:MAG: SEC-C metal-binding domain-containing protein [Acidimicrobiales bacterium]